MRINQIRAPARTTFDNDADSRRSPRFFSLRRPSAVRGATETKGDTSRRLCSLVEEPEGGGTIFTSIFVLVGCLGMLLEIDKMGSA